MDPFTQSTSVTEGQVSRKNFTSAPKKDSENEKTAKVEKSLMEAKKKSKSLKRMTNKICHISAAVNLFTKKIKKENRTNKINDEENLKEECHKLKNELQQISLKIKEFEGEKEDWIIKETELVNEKEKLANELQLIIKRAKQMEEDRNGWIKKEAELVNENEKLKNELNTNIKKDKEMEAENNNQYNNTVLKLPEIKSDIGQLDDIRTKDQNTNEIFGEENGSEQEINALLDNGCLESSQWKEKAEKLEKEMDFLAYIIDSYNIIKIDGIV